MEYSENIRNLFFKELVIRMIINSVPAMPKINKAAPLSEKLEQASKKPPVLEIKKPIKVIKKEKLMQPSPKQATPPHTIPGKPTSKVIPLKTTTKPIKLQPKPMQIPKKPGLPILERLRPILADSSVQRINCPGPNKNISIVRRGITQPVAMSFTAEEIKLFLKDLSEKTRIPLLPGPFKVFIQNLIITAIVSEFIETKFIIEKRSMQTQPRLPIKARF